MSGSFRRGARQDLPPAPLPQTEGVSAPVNTQVVNGFWQFLPAKSTTFFSRVWFRNYPKPLFIGALPPFPVPLPILTMVVPNNQAFIMKSADFQVFEQSGVGLEDLVAVPPSRVASYFGFEVKMGNKSPYDFVSNVTARGQVIDYKPGSGQAGSIVSPPTAGQGTVFPFSGANQPMGESFAAYAMAGDLINLTAYVLREPVYDARMLSVKFEGYNVNQRLLETILTRISK